MVKVRTALLTVVMLATGVYFVLYLYGWEWYRAFMVGVIFLAAELAAVGSHIVTVVRTSNQSAPGLPQARREHARGRHGAGERVVADVLETTAPSHYDTFRWLRPRDGQLSVFIPLLLGAGVFMSALAWLLERVAGTLYGDRIDDHVAQVAAPLIPPDDLFDIPTSTALLTKPGQWESWSDAVALGEWGSAGVER